MYVLKRECKLQGDFYAKHVRIVTVAFGCCFLGVIVNDGEFVIHDNSFFD